jgi:spermidine synthase
MPAKPTFPPAVISEYDGVRSLHLGSIWIQGSMRIGKPDWVELDYVRRMLASLLWITPEDLGRGLAVQLGLGAGAITRFTCKALRMRTLAVEINPLVIAACRRSFHLPADGPKLQVLCADAGGWVRDAGNRGRVQLLHVDLYDHEAAAPVLDDQRFYADCRTVLADGGVMSVNLFGRDSSFANSVANIVAAFDPGQVCSLRPTREGNSVMLLERAALIEARFGRHGLPARKWLRMLRHPAAADTEAKP